MSVPPTVGLTARLSWSEPIDGSWAAAHAQGIVSWVDGKGRTVAIRLPDGRELMAHRTGAKGWLVSGGPRMVRVSFAAPAGAA